MGEVRPLVAAPDVVALREALAEYTVDGVLATIGLGGQSALSRNDLDGVAANLGDRAVDDLLRLFLLGLPLTEQVE